jgi:hypothetical protein
MFKEKQMHKQMAAAVLSIAALSTAWAGEQEAYLGTAADAATTAAALASPGLGEMNPLGWATVPLRLGIMQYAKTLPREEGQPVMDAVSASGWGAAANNLLVLAGASGVAAPIVGLAIGYAVWKSGETEREFWHMCALHRKMEGQADCKMQAWTAEDVVRVAQAEYDKRQLAAAPVQLNVAAATASVAR